MSLLQTGIIFLSWKSFDESNSEILIREAQSPSKSNCGLTEDTRGLAKEEEEKKSFQSKM